MAITNKDVDKLKEVFATKEDLGLVKEDIQGLKKETRGLRQDLDTLTDMVRTGFDRVMGEFEKIREDRVIAKAKDDQQDRRLDLIEAKIGV